MLGSTQGVGKSYGAAAWALAYTAKYLRPGQVTWWAVPTSKQGEPTYDLIRGWTAHSGLLRRSTLSPPRLFIPGPRQIGFVSWERDENLLGPPIDALVVDQAELLTPKARAILSSRRGARQGPARYLGNAGVAGSEFHKLWMQAEREPDKTRMDCVKWTWRDYRDCLPAGAREEYERFVANERATLLASEFARLYEAEWSPPEQAILAPVIAKMATAAPSKDPHSGHTYVCSWDVGATSDYVVGMPLCLQCWTVTDMIRFLPGDISGLWRVFAEYSNHWNRARAFVEVNGIGRGPFDQLAASGYPCEAWTMNNDNKRDAVFEVVRRGYGGLLTVAPLPVLLEEALVFQSHQAPSGVWTFGAPSGVHDDTVAALLIAIGAMTQGPAAMIRMFAERAAAGLPEKKP